MSKKITKEEVNRKIGECEVDIEHLKSLADEYETRAEAGALTEEDYDNIVKTTIEQSQKVGAIRYGKGYLNGYADGVKYGVCATIASLALGAVMLYGKYVIEKL